MSNNIMQVINETNPAQIPDLEIVRKKYIENYNACNREKVGELMYHRNVVHFKQMMMANDKLKQADRFSLYACFVTAAVNGYSLDPADNEVYLIPRDGKAMLDRQAGAYVRRLIRTGQIKHAEQAKLVYEGDTFQVENGRVIRHVENYQTDNIIAGYVRFVIDDTGADRYFVYRKSDFESWRKKSPNPKSVEKDGKFGKYVSESLWDNGIVGGTQPEPNFLRTKIIKHAAKEKCWATGTTLIQIEHYAEVEIETNREDFKNPLLDDAGTNQPQLPNAAPAPTPAATPSPQNMTVVDDDFVPETTSQAPTVVHDEDDFLSSK